MPAEIVDIEGDFRYDCGLGAAANRDGERNKARIAAHHFDKEQAFTGERGISNPVNRLKLY